MTALSVLGLQLPVAFLKGYSELAKSVDVVIFPQMSAVVTQIKMPYVLVVHDLMYKEFPGLKEFGLRVRIAGDRLLRLAGPRARRVVTDSEVGREHVEKHLGVNRSRISVIPFIPSHSILRYRNMSAFESERVLSGYELPERFFFYPAQFWSHKNHIGLLGALVLIEERYGQQVGLVCCGAAKDSHDAVQRFVREKKMSQVVCLGYVSDIVVAALYKRSIGLVYPSFFGPTNIPPLEAMAMGKPVACANVYGVKDQLGHAALLFDPRSGEDIAKKVYALWNSETTRKLLVQRGYEKCANMSLRKYAESWISVVEACGLSY